MKMKKVKMMLLGILATALTASFGFAAEMTYNANLKGNDVVPTVKTKGNGDIKLEMTGDGKGMTFKLRVENIENASAASIQHGAAGKNGSPLVNLFSGPKKAGKFNGSLAEGTITDKDLSGDLNGKTVSDLEQLIKSGETYVIVNTDANPGGEIRGQVK